MSRPGSALGTRLRPQTAKPSVIFRISEPTNEMFQATEGNARGKELVGGKSDAMDLGSFVGLGEDEINKLSIVVTVRYNDERGRIQVPLKVLRHEWNMREVRLEKTSNFDALYQNIKSVQDIIQNQRLDPATKMTWIDRILGSSALSGIISRYNRLNATPTYKLYLLTQELELILKQIDSYKTHLFGERNSFDFAPRTGNVKAEELKSLKQHCDTATNTTITQSQSLRKAFQTQLKKHLENANRVEGIQTSKPFASLTYAEKNPTVRPFVSQILNPKQMQQVLGDKQLSGNQSDLLIQVEDILLNQGKRTKGKRTKVRAILDTGEGKSFLAEKLAEYERILGPEELGIININLANQSRLGELASASDSLDKKLIIIDEDFFIPDDHKDLRALVDKGARIIRFGASENPVKLADSSERLEEKDPILQEIRENKKQIRLLKKELLDLDTKRRTYAKHMSDLQQCYQIVQLMDSERTLKFLRFDGKNFAQRLKLIYPEINCTPFINLSIPPHTFLEQHKDIVTFCLNLERHLAASSISADAERLESQIGALEDANYKLEQDNKANAAKARSRKKDFAEIERRRDLAYWRTSTATASTFDRSTDWAELVKANHQSGARSQNIFPGLSLGAKEEIITKLQGILAHPGIDTELVVANIVEDGRHKCIIVKTGTAPITTEVGSKEWVDATEGITKAVMIYAGERNEFVVGGDYGNLSVLNPAIDRQNIFLSTPEHLNIDLLKQMYGRDRSMSDATTRHLFATKKALRDTLKKKDLASLKVGDEVGTEMMTVIAHANARLKDIHDMVVHLEKKVKKYGKKYDGMDVDKVIENVFTAYDSKHPDSLSPELYITDNGVEDDEKFIRDLRLLVFYKALETNKFNLTDYIALMEQDALEIDEDKKQELIKFYDEEVGYEPITTAGANPKPNPYCYTLHGRMDLISALPHLRQTVATKEILDELRKNDFAAIAAETSVEDQAKEKIKALKVTLNKAAQDMFGCVDSANYQFLGTEPPITFNKLSDSEFIYGKEKFVFSGDTMTFNSIQVDHSNIQACSEVVNIFLPLTLQQEKTRKLAELRKDFETILDDKGEEVVIESRTYSPSDKSTIHELDLMRKKFTTEKEKQDKELKKFFDDLVLDIFGEREVEDFERKGLVLELELQEIIRSEFVWKVANDGTETFSWLYTDFSFSPDGHLVATNTGQGLEKVDTGFIAELKTEVIKGLEKEKQSQLKKLKELQTQLLGKEVAADDVVRGTLHEILEAQKILEEKIATKLKESAEASLASYTTRSEEALKKESKGRKSFHDQLSYFNGITKPTPSLSLANYRNSDEAKEGQYAKLTPDDLTLKSAYQYHKAEFVGIKFVETGTEERGKKIFNDADLTQAVFRNCVFTNIDFSKIPLCSLNTIKFHRCRFEGECTFPKNFQLTKGVNVDDTTVANITHALNLDADEYGLNMAPSVHCRVTSAKELKSSLTATKTPG